MEVFSRLCWKLLSYHVPVHCMWLVTSQSSDKRFVTHSLVHRDQRPYFDHWPRHHPPCLTYPTKCSDVLVYWTFVTVKRYPGIHCLTRRPWVSEQLRLGNWGVPVPHLLPASTTDILVPVRRWVEGLLTCTGVVLISVLYLSNNHYVTTTNDSQHLLWLSIATTCTRTLKVNWYLWCQIDYYK